MFKKVIVGISGGVDSAVAALMLKGKGFQITGVFMKNWDITNEIGECQVQKDFEDAKWICNKLQIPLVDVDFVRDYWNDVFSNLVENLETGCTPNPDIQCNKKIKFDKFFNYARHELGADAIATGHYACSSFGPYLERFKPDTDAALLKAADINKDQTFFLSQIPQESLRRTMFPLGNYLKKDVKKIAKEANLDLVVNKKESMGICFIGKRHFKDFIVEYIEDKSGDFVDMKTGCPVGKHNGLHQWTIGQGCRLAGVPISYYVFRKDRDKNIIYAVAGSNDPALFSDFMIAPSVHWIRREPEELSDGNGVFECEFRFQHRNPLVPCRLFKTSSNKLLIHLFKPLRAITPGQFAVFYSGEECLGSAEISYSGPPYCFLRKEVPDITDELEEPVKVLQSC